VPRAVWMNCASPCGNWKTMMPVFQPCACAAGRHVASVAGSMLPCPASALDAGVSAPSEGIRIKDPRRRRLAYHNLVERDASSSDLPVTGD
jgi:hypothetical protein